MSTGRLSATYTISTGDQQFQVGAPLKRELLSGWSLTTIATPEGLSVQLEKHVQSEADLTHADACAERITRYLTLEYSENAGNAFEVTRTAFAFAPDDPAQAGTLQPEAIRIGFDISASLTTYISAPDLMDALTKFDLQTAAGPALFSADVEAAREMFHVAMSTPHPVVRFLVLYTAIALFTVWRAGHASQRAIDQLLTQHDPTTRICNGPRGSETEFTRARNALIHAEDREKDSAAAIKEIERLTPAFKRAVGRILRKG
jgi:hypothetical protein